MKTLVLAPGAAHLVHLFFEWFAIACGVQLYRRQLARGGGPGLLQAGRYGVVIGCILGAATGNKLVFWLEYPHLWSSFSGGLTALVAGQSIVGGLLGGLAGVEIAKKLTGVSDSTGDNFVLPLMAGTVIGRVGCFLAGLNDGTFGDPTALPWGVDFGDGVARHPTQIYDMLFVLGWGGALLLTARRWRETPGLLFKLYLAGYLTWRLLVDGIKPIPYYYPGQLSGIQLVCLLALAAYLPFVVKPFFAKDRHAISLH